MIKFVLTILLVLISLFVNAQFLRTYDMVGQPYEIILSSDIQQSANGPIMLNTIDSTAEKTYSVLSAYDNNGYPLWAEKITNDSGYVFLSKHCVLSDGTIVALGTAVISANAFRTIIVRIASGGTLIWARNIVETPGVDVGNIKETPDGNIAVCTSISAGNNSQIAILKIDLNGNLINQFTYTVNGEQQGGMATASDIYPNQDGGYTVCGKTPLYGTTLVFRINSTGQVMWSWKDIMHCSMTSTINSNPKCITYINNHYLICGELANSSNYVVFILLDENGNLKWGRFYQLPCNSVRIEDCYASSWGYFVATGTAAVTTSVDFHPMMFSVDLFGNPTNGFRYFNYSLPSSITVSSNGLCVTSTGTYFMGAYTNDWPQNHLALISTDSAGVSACPTIVDTAYVPYYFNRQNCPLISGSSVSLQSATVYTETIALTTSTICGSVLSANPDQNNNEQFEMHVESQQLIVQTSDSYKDAVLELYDISGRLVLQTPITSNYQTVKLNGIASGIYIANVISTKNYIHTQKIHIQ